MRGTTIPAALLAAAALTGCGSEAEHEAAPSSEPVTGTEWTVRDTVLASVFQASGVARAVADATLSTKLMGEVVAVAIREGDVVRRGQTLVRLDAAELEARRAQVEASIREAEAVVRDAETQAERMRALYAEDAAPKVQLDAAETGLERARSKLATGRAAAAEVEAMARYARVDAPFDGVVTTRYVDVGDFAAPGAPLATVLDDSRLRIAATAAPDAVRGIGRGDTLQAEIEGAPVAAVVEGVVPNQAGVLYTVNALVDNEGRRFLPGSAATLALPQGTRRAVMVPARALIRQGDLTGVRVRTDDGTALRWIRLGERRDDAWEVLAGLEAGDVIVVPEPVESEGGAGTARGGSEDA